MEKKKKRKDEDEDMPELIDIEEDSDHPVHERYTKEKKYMR